MPIQFEDAQDITGVEQPVRPLTTRQMQGAVNRNVHRTQIGPKITNPARQSAGGKPDGKPDDKAQPDQADGEPKPEGDVAQQPQKGIAPAWKALTDGVGAITQDPEWQKHPLLKLFSDPTTDPSQMGQDLWSATQWWGRVVNAALDLHAIHAASANIEHDNSIGGRIAQNMFGIHNDPASEFAWNLMPSLLVMGAEFEPWLWLPSLAAGGPSKLSDLPQAVMGLFGNDLKHPQFQDPAWYERMGAYILGGIVAAKGGGKAMGPLFKYSGRLKLLEPFAAHADRILGGPGEKTPIKMPDGVVYDPVHDPQGHAYAQWWHDNLKPVEETTSEIGKPAAKPADQLIAHPEIDNAYVKQAGDPTALRDLANLLGIDPTAGPDTIANQFFAMAEHRQISPELSAKIAKQWSRFGSVVGQMGKLKYWHPGEEPYRDVLASLEKITDPQRKASAEAAMRAVNGLHADLGKGIHGYGNDLSEALVKGILNHGRSTPFYINKAAEALREVLPTAAERARITRVIEAPNTAGGAEFGRSLYDSLLPHEKWAVDFYRRLAGEVRSTKQAWGRQMEAQPNFVYRVPKRVGNLEAILKGIPEDVRAKAAQAARRSPFGYVAKEHRAFQLTTDPTSGEIRAEPAYATTEDANIKRAQWRQQIKADLVERAKKDPALKKITDDPKKLDALALAEIPDFSTDILDSVLGSGDRGMVPDINALYTHQVMETAKQTMVKHSDGQFHPLAVARSEAGQESSPTLSEHFKYLHGADTTTDFYKNQGWTGIDGFGSGHIFHPSFAGPLNTALRFGKGNSDLAMRALEKATGFGKKMVMLNPAWHTGNMMGRFLMLAGGHPSAVFRTILKARGMRDLTEAQARQWWDMQEHEAFEHGLLPPQLNEDVVASAGRYHALSTGDVETGTPLDGKQPVQGIPAAAADTLNAVKGVHSWWQNHVNSLMWSKIHDFGVLSYIVLKDDAIHRGMSPGDARLMASSQANSFAGMVSPDRWMHSPAMHDLSQTLLFAPNWWRTFPRILANSYDRMGMKSSPALTNAWALNGAKTIGAMILLKGATDNLLNWALSGHWQFQNPDGYKNQVTMDRFFPTDPTTGAHHIMEDPLFRQSTDLEKALGMYQPMQYGNWHPDFTQGAQGAAEVVAARASPLVDALETATNWDVYNTIKQRAMRWVDPSHPGFAASPQALGAAALNFAPFGPAYMAQAGLQGATAQPGTLDWGPFKGTKVPGWAMRAFDPNDPMSQVLSWLGVRGGYPAPVSSQERGLSSDELTQLHKYTNDWNNYLTKQQNAVMGGGETWSSFAYNYKQQAAAYSNKVQGLVGGTSQYMQGADGLLAQYEAVYNDPKATDANGDINWAYVQRQQDQMQAKTDPATWRQMIALKDKREMQFPVLRVYKDSLQNYKNFQDTWAKEQGLDGETLRSQIADAAGSPSFQQYEAQHPEIARWYQAKRQWELTTKQGFAYGLFSDGTYVMRVVAPHGTKAETTAAETKILPQIEAEEKAGTFVTSTGE